MVDLVVASQGFEPQLIGPKPIVLPLDDKALFVRTNGFEPLASGIKQAGALPLSYVLKTYLSIFSNSLIDFPASCPSFFSAIKAKIF